MTRTLSLLLLPLPLGLFLLLLLWPESSKACFRHDYYNFRRVARSHIFVRDEYEPRTREVNFMASGPISPADFIDDYKKLTRVSDHNIRFHDEATRRMSERCREKVVQLAVLVRSAWPRGVYLEITQAWIRPYRIVRRRHFVGPHDELHFAGRAVDMRLYTNGPDGRRSSLGRLAMMASYEATFDWCILTTNHVHCSVKPDTPSSQRWFGCLHGNSVVQLSNQTFRRVADLQVGDQVLSRNSNGFLYYSPIVTFLHRQPHHRLSFLLLRLSDNVSTIAVTPNHLVFRLAAGTADPEAVFAAELRPGNRLVRFMTTAAAASNGDIHGSMRIIRLAQIDSVEDHGAYAPVTASGTIVVDSLLVSSYAHVRNHNLAHFVLSPARLAYRLGVTDYSSSDAIGRYTRFLLWLGKRLLPKGLLYEW